MKRLTNLLRLALYDWTKGMPPLRRAAFYACFLFLILCLLTLEPKGAVEWLIAIAVFLLSGATLNALVAADFEKMLKYESEELAAQRIQTLLQPRAIPPFAGLDIAGRTRTAHRTGGDYYDVIPVGDGRLVFLIADVSGKGIGAALIMSNLQAIIRTLLKTTEAIESVAAQINDHLVRYTDTAKFVTVFLGQMDLERQKLRYVNSGHNPPLCLRPGGRLAALDISGLPLGLMDDAQIACADVDLGDEGLLLFLYTDGLTDRENRRGEPFGVERVVELLRENCDRPASAVIDTVLDRNDRFAGGQPAEDDITVLAIKTVRRSI